MPQQNNNIDKIFDFFELAGKLKKTRRYLTRRNMPKESVADHSWRLVLMSFIIAEELKLKIDIIKAMKIALVHDIGESITGDIDIRLIYKNIVSQAKKDRQELKALQKIKSSLPASLGRQIYNLWQEYEKGRTAEGRYIKALDKIEALIYLVENGHKTYTDPEIIPVYADKEVANFPELKGILKKLKRKIKKIFIKAQLEWKKDYEKI